MSYTDLLQSYQDRLSAMTQNEESIGDFLINKANEKINSYLEQAGIPSQIGGAIEQFGLLANNSAVKTLLQQSGLQGVLDEKMEGLSRNINGLKDQVKAVADKTSTAIDEQVAAAKAKAQPLLDTSQEALNTAKSAEEQVRAGLQTASQLPAQAQAAGQQALDDAQTAATQVASEAQAAGQQAALGSQEYFDQMIGEMTRQQNQPAETEPIAPEPARPPADYQTPEEPVSVPPQSQELTEFARDATKTEDIVSDVGKVGTGLEETSGELPGVGEIGEVFGALLQIGSLIASAFKPHEDVQTITTPITGFGFGAMNQYGVGGSSIV